MGGRVPDQNQPDDAFSYGAPPMMIYDQPGVQPNGAIVPAAPYANGAMLDALDEVNGTILR
jgi:hypothetical protein